MCCPKGYGHLPTKKKIAKNIQVHQHGTHNNDD